MFEDNAAGSIVGPTTIRKDPSFFKVLPVDLASRHRCERKDEGSDSTFIAEIQCPAVGIQMPWKSACSGFVHPSGCGMASPLVWQVVLLHTVSDHPPLKSEPWQTVHDEKPVVSTHSP